MASNTRPIETVPSEIFRFTTTRQGTITFFSNDLNISFRVLFQGPGILLSVHVGPILFLSSSACGRGITVTATAMSIGNAFPPPPLSLLELQTDTIAQAPSATFLPGKKQEKKGRNRRPDLLSLLRSSALIPSPIPPSEH